MMTPAEQNIAIAEACGTRLVLAEDGWWDTEINGVLIHQGLIKEALIDRLPSYTTDLNAMHEAEKTLIDWVEYRINLSHVVGIGYAPDLDICDDIKSFLSATAAQRAEAFLKTIGKWKD